MKKQLLKSALIAVAGLGLLAGTAQATLQDTLNGITVGGPSSVNATTDMMSDTNDSYWNITASGGSFATMVLNIAGLGTGSTFGIYDSSNKNNFVELFSGSQTSAGQHATVSILDDGTVVRNLFDQAGTFTGGTFGYYINFNGITYYSDSTLNQGGIDHMYAFRGTGDTVQIGDWKPGPWTNNEYVLAFENGSDFDFNDLVVMVESVDPVPEPTTMLLFGVGLLGLAGAARRKSSN
ncbi:PEP-CTERM sorting domain-containing protein [Desulfobulbus sp.]|uniref:PEP-CTERM sorting domain-containing protein n=1 Tax=Desulfobulbus sp. TaxID=895 RepID=UPI00286FA9CB|nr:PEP-CTERM sorting domain-containing protein [Desulfobulbus sp.]